MLRVVCRRLKAIVPRFFDRFSDVSDVESINIDNGIVSIAGDEVRDGAITLVGVPYPDELSREHINYTHEIETGNFQITQEYITFSDVGGKIHQDIRIIIKATEQLAFEHFKQDIRDTIFIIPMDAKGVKLDSYNSNSDTKQVTDSFRVVVYLYDENEESKNRYESIANSYELRDIIVRALMGVRVVNEQEGKTIDFIRNNYEFSTKNTMIISLDFEVERLLTPIDTDFGYLLEYEGNEPLDLR